MVHKGLKMKDVAIPSTLTSVPDIEVPVGISGQDIPGVEEGDRGDVLRFFPGLEDAHPLGQHPALVQPEGDVAAPAGDDGVAVRGGELHRQHRVARTLQQENY